jgi:phenylalanine-4-hydroxylase
VPQTRVASKRACHEYNQGLALLDLPKDRIPQCHEISTILQDTTGWALQPVSGFIPVDQFFNLLANRKFPAATFIRCREELEYAEEPDIFHEVFGHCPLLTNKSYADFMQSIAKFALTISQQDRDILARLYWFTFEVGLVATANGLRAYGGGILSSSCETAYCLESTMPSRQTFDLLKVLRTPFQVDIIQPIYYVIDHLDSLFELTDMDFMPFIREARAMGDYHFIQKDN